MATFATLKHPVTILSHRETDPKKFNKVDCNTLLLCWILKQSGLSERLNNHESHTIDLLSIQIGKYETLTRFNIVSDLLGQPAPYQYRSPKWDSNVGLTGILYTWICNRTLDCSVTMAGLNPELIFIQNWMFFGCK